MRIIFWAGDSTNTCNKANKYPQTGIAQAFDRYTRPDVVIYDHAINGRSTKSFIDQGRLATINDEIKEGDFLFIQFGHNDEKKTDFSRYTDPKGSFVDNLGKFVNVARNRGAIPLFITPLERRSFEDDHVHLRKSDHEPYVEGYYIASEKYNVPIIDLYKVSREFIEKTGDEPTKKYFMHVKPGEVFWLPDGLSTDNTHLRYEGAMKFGELLAGEIIKAGEPYASLIDETVLAELKMVHDSNLMDEGVADEYK
ncbi:MULTISPECIES: rhamnogalacturonan acetylesterase [unclassified Butyrivibrio]|jgi:lysophospholipase L1-like esterase|uniref:rhamnogalacturonan acetylesterase n=1 Tax=unclassified Butyrivibrio TaxID=2639466 RepID=UPI000406FAFB|nr:MULTISPECIES: rhamnogalacturonan acetylesterase [unclassified Butyrivibrio]MCR5342252.1 rhamnogalacturonan acetylesterase [Butyrivibrio sp.]SEM33080.1 Lysophospholipase L1 [Butyrivibrio sp. ob235]